MSYPLGHFSLKLNLEQLTRYIPPPKVRVRCLGPGPEHTFLSGDRCRERICPKCRTGVAYTLSHSGCYSPVHLTMKPEVYKE